MQNLKKPNIQFVFFEGKKTEIIVAKKSQTMLVVDSYENMPNNSLFQKKYDNEEQIVTSLDNNKVEAISKANKNDYIACGINGEKWVIKEKNFGDLYKIENNIAYPIQQKYFIKIKSLKDLNWTNSWGETKSIPANTEYYLMANTSDTLINLDWKEINPMNVDVFNKTYKIESLNYKNYKKKKMKNEKSSFNK